jgi:lipoate-protein ligase A
MTEPWRLILDGPADGSMNMARDEALLAAAGRGARPALRLYSWKRPTLSLGAHQSAADVDLHACRRLGVDLVRRPTGGGAVLHDCEVTYAVAGRLGEAPFPRSVVAVYEVIAGALVAAMARLDVRAEASRGAATGRAPVNCFGAPSSRELVAQGRKLAGSAQLRRRGAFLQPGSILLAFDGALLGEVLPASRDSGPPATLRGLAGRPVAREEAERALEAAFAERLPAGLERASEDRAESEEAARLRCRKYLDAEWTLHGRVRDLA